MAKTTSTANFWEGSHQDIPTSSPTGLVFLRHFLTEMDKLSPDLGQIRRLLTPDTLLIINSGPASGLEDVIGMFEKRRGHLSRFGHRLERAWAVSNPADPGRQTVLFESISTTVFRADIDAMEVEVPEFTILDLEADHGSASVCGWRAVQVKTFMDASPVTTRAAQISS